MDHYPSRSQKHDSKDNLYTVDDPFTFDKGSGIYKPKAAKEEEKTSKESTITRVFVEVRNSRDIPASFSLPSP